MKSRRPWSPSEDPPRRYIAAHDSVIETALVIEVGAVFYGLLTWAAFDIHLAVCVWVALSAAALAAALFALAMMAWGR